MIIEFFGFLCVSVPLWLEFFAMTETERSLLDAVLENPDDDLPRLVYADYLDENGDPKRAGFIRAQIVMARSVLNQAYDSNEYVSATKQISTLSFSTIQTWLSRSGFAVSGFNSSGYDTINEIVRVSTESNFQKLQLLFRRGFVDSITSYPSWIVHNWKSVSSQPISKMTLLLHRRPDSIRSIAITFHSVSDSFCKIVAEIANGRSMPNSVSILFSKRSNYVSSYLDWLHDACRSLNCYEDAFPSLLT